MSMIFKWLYDCFRGATGQEHESVKAWNRFCLYVTVLVLCDNAGASMVFSRIYKGNKDGYRFLRLTEGLA